MDNNTGITNAALRAYAEQNPRLASFLQKYQGVLEGRSGMNQGMIEDPLYQGPNIETGGVSPTRTGAPLSEAIKGMKTYGVPGIDDPSATAPAPTKTGTFKAIMQALLSKLKRSPAVDPLSAGGKGSLGERLD